MTPGITSATGGMGHDLPIGLSTGHVNCSFDLCKDSAGADSLSGDSRCLSSALYASNSSVSSWTTQAATPRSVGSPSGSSRHSSASESAGSLVSSPEDRGKRDYGERCGRGSKSRAVRFADEDGGALVTEVRTAVDWWDEMVFGPARPASTTSSGARCAACESSGGSDGEESGGAEGVNTKRVKGCDGCKSANGRPGELFHFVEELSRGVEVTLLFPGIVCKKRRRAVLYTEDNAETICWMETGSVTTGEPFQLPCKFLVDVVDQTGVSSSDTMGEPGLRDSRCSSLRTESRKGSVTITRPNGSSSAMPRPTLGDKGGAVHASSMVNDSSKMLSVDGTDREGFGAAGCIAEGSVSGGEGQTGSEIRMKLKWRIKPTFPVRKVTIVDVKCANSRVFARGLLQLIGHNMELDDTNSIGRS